MKLKFNVYGMSCAACSARVEKAVGELDEVKNAAVDLFSNSLTVTADEDITERIIRAVENAGYKAEIFTEKNEQKKQDFPIKLLVSIICMLLIMYISMGSMINLPQIFKEPISIVISQMVLAGIVVVLNFKFFTNGYKALFRLSPNMDSLVALSATASYVYGIAAFIRLIEALSMGNTELAHSVAHNLYFESAAMVLGLISVGKYFESRSKEKTTGALKKLYELNPTTVNVIENGQEKNKRIDEIAVGETVVLRTGDKVAFDGTVTKGFGVFDESAVTGESMPVEKGENKVIISGSVLKTGYLEYRVEKAGGDTTIAQIIRLVEEASVSKAPIAKTADKICLYFVPAVILTAILSFVVWILLGESFEFAVNIGLSVLVISCPCALGLATPTAIMVGTGIGAKNAILIKSAESLEILHKAKNIVLDKTGTITEGRLEVADVLEFDDRVKSYAKSMEEKSSHPIAQAITEYCKNEKTVEVCEFTQLEGMGISGKIAGEKYIAGNQRLMKQNGIDVDEIEQKSDGTVIYLAKENQLLGCFELMDTVKKSSIKAIKLLAEEGLSVFVLTGDNRRAAKKLENVEGITRVTAELLPHEKNENITKLKEEGITVMVGDGVNDAPALVTADVGIAVGAGTDIAMDSADIILSNSNLLNVYKAIKLSKAVMRNIKQNLFWAFFYNILGIPIAAGVFSAWGLTLNPMIGAAAMSLSSIFVVTNALRLNAFKIDIKEEDKKMRKIYIDGMMCAHCTGRVEKALNDMPGVTASVSLDEKCASVEAPDEITNEALKEAVEAQGYKVVSFE